MNRFLIFPSLGALCLLACAAEEVSGGDDPGTGGSFATGGTAGASAGGSTASGGALSSGGTGGKGGTSPGSGGSLASGGTAGSGGSSGACTNIRPTGTDWDEATCEQWATQTDECDAPWMVNNGYCNESCGRCTPGGAGGSTGAGGSNATGGSAGAGGSNAAGGSAGAGGSGGTSTEPKFVGNITTNNQINAAGRNFATYWDQITPENAGKWGSVQFSTGSGFNWGTLDAIYDYAQANNIIFKQHAFVWGQQQPSGTPNESQVINWISSFCQRYPKTKLIDVVNEPPPHTTPNYANNIGGGTNGNWQWITNAFKWARQYCPNAILILNDYNNIEWPDDNQHFIDIVKTVRSNGGPIDAVGAQAHDLDHGSVTPDKVKMLLNKLHQDTGLPVYITEMDLSYTDDNQQLAEYQKYFPMFMEADFVPGITIWGWIYGSTWSLAPNSGLIRNGQPRPAMTWLMQQLGRPAP